jgi:hypothetical protein
MADTVNEHPPENSPCARFIISAGFTQLGPDSEDRMIYCFGESESLNIKSLPEDSAILTQQYSPY